MTIETRDWHAWLNAMPPGPESFHVTGEVLVGNPGVLAQLSVKHPQGINSDILLLDLNLVQQPGMWAQVMTWAQARFDKTLPPKCARYKHVEIFYNNEKIAEMPVQIVV